MVRFGRSDDRIEVPLLDPLFQDMVECEEGLASEGTEFWRRTYVRCSFAFIEGALYWLRGTFRQMQKKVLDGASDTDLLKLMAMSDFSPCVDDTGGISAQPNRQTMAQQCAVTFRTGAMLAQTDSDKFFSDNGWRCFRDAQKVRDRITHPKNPSDLEISEDEIEVIREAHTWFLNCIVDIINAGLPPDGKPPA